MAAVAELAAQQVILYLEPVARMGVPVEGKTTRLPHSLERTPSDRALNLKEPEKQAQQMQMDTEVREVEDTAALADA